MSTLYAYESDTDKDILIAKVFKRSVIWDRRLKGHANRSIVDRAWKEIAAEMGVEDDTLLRKKWKYLRDQFAVEIGKSVPSRSSEPSSNPESRWEYFKSLKFLIGIVKPRNPLGAVKGSRSQLSNHLDNDNVDIVIQSVESVPVEKIEEKPKEEPIDESLSLTRKRKRNSYTDTIYSQEIFQPENKKVDLSERVYNERNSDDCDDEWFFKSLLPFVRKIPNHMKLRFRTKVLQLVDDFAHPVISQGYLNVTSPSSSYGEPSSNSIEH